jgi:hypothetical protein
MASIFERLSLYPKIKKQEVFSYGKYKKRCNYPNSVIGKEKAIISDGLSSVAPLFDERCNYNAIIEYVTIRKLKG